jgi:hypothetical protein
MWFIPDVGAVEMEWFNELQRVSTSPENAAHLMDSRPFRLLVVRFVTDRSVVVTVLSPFSLPLKGERLSAPDGPS